MDTEAVPIKALVGAADDIADRDRGFAATSGELSTTLDELKEACTAEIRAVVEPSVLPEYEKGHDLIKARIAELESTRKATTESIETTGRMRTKLLLEAKQLTKELGIDPARIAEIQRRYTARANTAVQSAFASAEQAPYVEAGPEPLSTRQAWQWFSTPYAGSATSRWDYGSGGHRATGCSANRLTGELDTWSAQSLYGADDSDYSYTSALAEHRFWFRMPTAGMVEVMVYLQGINNTFGGCLEDEWGFSDASIQQVSRPYLQVVSPSGGRRFGTLLDYRRGEVEGSWATSIVTPGDLRYAHLFSAEAYAAGQLLLCGIGIYDYNYFWVNDMSCRTTMTNRWFVKQVAVRSTGA